MTCLTPIYRTTSLWLIKGETPFLIHPCSLLLITIKLFIMKAILELIQARLVQLRNEGKYGTQEYLDLVDLRLKLS